ncbi:MAG: CoB--CoM heterodisulfide reductase iron-sulfur subunit A family protein [Proteobacteria bacterium]|nr:CoB--CoM heterodisulfide reductase iron-sulfur subunit A family protein [Pseudomonadota bacterium]
MPIVRNALSDSEILVIGAGVGGIRAAVGLAELGHRVCLVEKSPATGGVLTQLDHQFPDNHCGMCRMLPMIEREAGPQFCLKKGLVHDNILILPSTELVSLEGSTGQYHAVLSRSPEGIDPGKCTNCGECVSACPVEVPETFSGGIGKRKAVYLPVPNRLPGSPVVDWDLCTRCGDCLEVCPDDAINLDQETERIEMKGIDGVIQASGTPLFDPSELDVFGFGELPNVVTATAFERILSGSGPHRGMPVRPSDDREIRKIAWIQCVGSRNLMIGADYCSSICCMFAIKEAVLASEKIGTEAETTIFYMDMRTFGRDFQRYREQAEKEFGVRFIRCRTHSIERGENPDDLEISYIDSRGRQVKEIFDLVVLSTGQAPERKSLAFESDSLNREGVFVLDSAKGLKDISESVVEAEAVAGRISRLTQKTDRKATESDTEECTTAISNIYDDRPSPLIFLSRFADDRDGFVDWNEIVSELRLLPSAPAVEVVDGIFADGYWETIKNTVKAEGANRLLLATCKPNVPSSRTGKLEREVGLAASLVEVVNLHFLASDRSGKSLTTRAILREIEMGLMRLVSRKPRNGEPIVVTGGCLVVGAGPAGLGAALALADFGIEVALVEKSADIGGNARFILDAVVKEPISKLLDRVENHPRISIHTEAEVFQTSGTSGRFASSIRLKSGETRSLDHGATILATGGAVAQPQEYKLGEHEGVLTHFELEKRISDSTSSFRPLRCAVMIQCAGSREAPNNFCSRTCCQKSLQNAMRIREMHPESTVYIFYRDIMTLGESERIYTEARRKGVIFLPFDSNEKPEVRIISGNLLVQGYDRVAGKPAVFKPDLVALSVGMVPNRPDDLVKIFGLQMTEDGFIKEADSKWRPVDSGREGVFVCGLARAPGQAAAAVIEGEAAAHRAMRILNRPLIPSQRVTAGIKRTLCSLCETCIEVCPHHARFLDAAENAVLVDPAACQGCGLCAAACPNGAAVTGDFEDAGIMGMIEAAL